MKKLVLIFAVILVSYGGIAQVATPSNQLRIADTTTATLGQNIPKGTTVYVISIDRYFVAKSACISTDKVTYLKFSNQGKLNVGTSNGLSITNNGQTVNMAAASTSTTGALSNTDWNTFNGKENALTKGNLTETTSGVLTITGGTGAVIGSGASIQVKQANTSQGGYLSNTDWNTFNGKEDNLTFSAPLVNTAHTITISAATTGTAGSMSGADKTKLDAITGSNTGDQTITLTGDVTGSGTGSFATTIANSSVTLAKQANVATGTIMGRTTAGTGVQEALTVAQVKTMLGTGGIAAVYDYEQLVDSVTLNTGGTYNRVTLANTPLTGSIAVQLNGLNLKPTQWALRSSTKICILVPCYQYDQVQVSYSY